MCPIGGGNQRTGQSTRQEHGKRAERVTHRGTQHCQMHAAAMPRAACMPCATGDKTKGWENVQAGAKQSMLENACAQRDLVVLQVLGPKWHGDEVAWARNGVSSLAGATQSPNNNLSSQAAHRNERVKQKGSYSLRSDVPLRGTLIVRGSHQLSGCIPGCWAGVPTLPACRSGTRLSDSSDVERLQPQGTIAGEVQPAQPAPACCSSSSKPAAGARMLHGDTGCAAAACAACAAHVP